MINVPIILPDKIGSFTYTWRSLDWKGQPPFSNTGNWPEKEFKLRRQMHESEIDLAYAKDQYGQLLKIQNQLVERQKRGEIELDMEIMAVNAQIYLGLQTTDSWVNTYTRRRDNAQRDIMVIERQRDEGSRLAELLKLIEIDYQSMVIASPQNIASSKKKLDRTAKELDGILAIMPAKKIKFKNIPPAALEIYLPKAHAALAALASSKKKKQDQVKWSEMIEEEQKALIGASFSSRLKGWCLTNIYSGRVEDLYRQYIKAVKSNSDKKKRQVLQELCDGSIPRFCVEVRDFFVESAYTDEELALAMHTSALGNTSCRYHHYHRNRRECDSVVGFVGVGFTRKLATDLKTVVKPEPGHMNCGCSIEEVLIEYNCWKLTNLYSTNPALNDHRFNLRDDDNITPLFRAYMVQVMRDTSAMEFSDFFGFYQSNEDDWQIYWAKVTLMRTANKLKATEMTRQRAQEKEAKKKGLDGK